MAEITPEDLIKIVESHIIHTQDEIQLQNEVEKLFIRYGVEYQREVNLTPEDRIDFLVGSIGIELKVDGSWTQVSKQLQRYAKSDRVSFLILITTRSKHASVPTQLGGKTVYRLILLNRAF